MNEPVPMGDSMGYFLQWSGHEKAWVLKVPFMESDGYFREFLFHGDLPRLGQDDEERAKVWAEQQLAAKGWTVTGWRRDLHGRLTPGLAAQQKKRITSAQEWADAMDAEMKRTGMGAGTLMSFGHANGHILGVPLDPGHPDADDERGVVASTSGWVVAWDNQNRWWSPF